MPVTLRPIGHLKSAVNDQTELAVPAGISVREALILIKIPPEVVALVVINGIHQTDKDTILQDGDIIKLMAVIGGG
ncbi:MAG TPA: MoaD/ThiS family protein [Anaerolineales bacterium]|nr:MoaD/ThiS family protein [Anaerolineales bacterium]